MENLIVTAILAVIIGFAVRYIYKSKKSGHKCIGCPDSGSCSSCCSGGGQGCNGCGSK